MRYVSFDKHCKKCKKHVEEVKIPHNEFEEMMKKREIGDSTPFESICEDCKNLKG